MGKGIKKKFAVVYGVLMAYSSTVGAKEGEQSQALSSFHLNGGLQVVLFSIW